MFNFKKSFFFTDIKAEFLNNINIKIELKTRLLI